MQGYRPPHADTTHRERDRDHTLLLLPLSPVAERPVWLWLPRQVGCGPYRDRDHYRDRDRGSTLLYLATETTATSYYYRDRDCGSTVTAMIARTGLGQGVVARL